MPSGAELDALRAIVGDDLPDDAQLLDLVGGEWDEELPLSKRAAIPRIRPILVALAARAAGAAEVEGEALYAAELLHLALSVHDLALGRQGGRRRRVARKVVRSMSWLGGNHLTLRALELCRHTSPEILSELVDTLRAFSDGQALSRELATAGALPGADDWLEHADAHTAALFSFCCRAGGHLAGAEPAVVSALGRYGRHVGRMWHAAEDVAVLEHGDVTHLVTRASVARPMLVIIAAGQRDPRVAALWCELVAHGEPDVAETLGRRALELGRGPVREVLVRESWAARKAIRALPDSTYRSTLERLPRGLVRAGERTPAG